MSDKAPSLAKLQCCDSEFKSDIEILSILMHQGHFNCSMCNLIMRERNSRGALNILLSFFCLMEILFR